MKYYKVTTRGWETESVKDFTLSGVYQHGSHILLWDSAVQQKHILKSFGEMMDYFARERLWADREYKIDRLLC